MPTDMWRVRGLIGARSLSVAREARELAVAWRGGIAVDG